MEPLSAGHQLRPAEEQVSRVRVFRARGIGMRIERPFAHWVARDEEEVAAMLGAHPLAQPALVLRREVRLAAHIYPMQPENQLLRLGEVDMRNLGGNLRHRD